MKKVGFCGSQTKNLITATLSVVVALYHHLQSKVEMEGGWRI